MFFPVWMNLAFFCSLIYLSTLLVFYFIDIFSHSLDSYSFSYFMFVSNVFTSHIFLTFPLIYICCLTVGLWKWSNIAERFPVELLNCLNLTYWISKGIMKPFTLAFFHSGINMYISMKVNALDIWLWLSMCYCSKLWG